MRFVSSRQFRRVMETRGTFLVQLHHLRRAAGAMFRRKPVRLVALALLGSAVTWSMVDTGALVASKGEGAGFDPIALLSIRSPGARGTGALTQTKRPFQRVLSKSRKRGTPQPHQRVLAEVRSRPPAAPSETPFDTGGPIAPAGFSPTSSALLDNAANPGAGFPPFDPATDFLSPFGAGGPPISTGTGPGPGTGPGGGGDGGGGVTTVPEVGTWVMMSIGIGVIGADYRRRRRRHLATRLGRKGCGSGQQ